MIYLAVWVGSKYPVIYVKRLQRMLRRHGDGTFIVLTDKPQEAAPYCDWTIDVTGIGLTGWWAKMALFSPMVRGWLSRAVYFDLDTVIVDDIRPLHMDVPFGICANFTVEAGNTKWPCKYGSCCMVFGREVWGSEVWAAFDRDRARIMRECGRYGDQKAIEMLVHPAEVTILQHALPPKFFLGYRDLVQYRTEKPPHCSVVVFAGTQKPDNCETAWVKRRWI